MRAISNFDDLSPAHALLKKKRHHAEREQSNIDWCNECLETLASLEPVT